MSEPTEQFERRRIKLSYGYQAEAETVEWAEVDAQVLGPIAYHRDSSPNEDDFAIGFIISHVATGYRCGHLWFAHELEARIATSIMRHWPGLDLDRTEPRQATDAHKAAYVACKICIAATIAAVLG